MPVARHVLALGYVRHLLRPTATMVPVTTLRALMVARAAVYLGQDSQLATATTESE